MKYMNDLSYQNIVDTIQGSVSIAADVLHAIAVEVEDNNKIINRLETAVKAARARSEELMGGTRHVLHHLKLYHPLIVKRRDYVIIIDESTIRIERNTI